MIQIDKTDKLYKYLCGLKVDDIDKLYLELASNGRSSNKEIKEYFYADFDAPNIDTSFLQDNSLALDYFKDIKRCKVLSSATINKKLKEFKNTLNKGLLEEIVNSKLVDVFYLSVCFKFNHKELNLMDIIQNANFGLIEAIKRYDETSRISIDDYILFYVRKALLEYKEKNNG